MQLAIGDFLVDRRIVALPQDRGLIAAAGEMAVDAVVRDVQPAVLEPSDASVVLEIHVLDPVREDDPVETLGLLGPKALRVVDRALVHLTVLRLVGMRGPGERWRHGKDVVRQGFLRWADGRLGPALQYCTADGSSTRSALYRSRCCSWRSATLRGTRSSTSIRIARGAWSSERIACSRPLNHLAPY